MSFFGINPFSSNSSLVKALKENRGSYTISRNGTVSLDLNDAKVKESIAQQIRKLDSLKEATAK